MRATLRRYALTLMAVGCVGSVTACGSGASSADAGTVRFGAFRTIGNTGVTTAELNGYFKDQGLKYEPIYSESVPATLQGVISGDIDIATSVPAVYFGAIGNGSCVKTLMPMASNDYNLVAQKSLKIDASAGFPEVLKQLEGKVIGVPARGGGPETLLRTWLRQAGLNPDTAVSFVAVGVGGSAITAFTSRKVDAMLSTSANEPRLGEFDYLAKFAGQSTGPLANYMQTTTIVNCEFAEKHPETVQKACAAINKGYQALAEDKAAGPKAMLELKMVNDQASADKLWSQYSKAVTYRPELTEANWKFQGTFAPPDTPVPDFTKYVVDGCATA